MYRCTTEDNEQSPERTRTVTGRPEWSIPRIGYSSQRGDFLSDYTDAYKRPDTIMNKETTWYPPSTRDQTIGTYKRTVHPPGYTGFIPRADINDSAIKQSICKEPRHKVDKTNITNNYKRKLVGHAGYQAVNATNDRGNVRPMCLSTMNESFC